MRLIPAFLVAFLLLSSLVAAEITLDKTSSTLYNYGDKLVASGQVTSSNSMRAYLTTTLQCSQSTPVATRIMDLDTNVAESFSHLIVIPEGQSGTCTIKTVLTDPEGIVLEEQASNEFVITSDLKAEFEPARESYQLGEKLDIKGILSKYNNQGIDGTAVFTFTRSNITISRDVHNVKLGTLSFTKDLTLLPPGIYTVDIFIRDNEGNSRTFPSAYTFTLEGNLELLGSTDRQTYKPGETVTLSGNVKSKSGTTLKDLELDFYVDGNKIGSQKLSTSELFYKFTYTIPNTIKSGTHSYLLSATDEQGNIGESGSNFTVQAIPTTLLLNVGETIFIPTEKISFNTQLLDQAGDPMTETLNIIFSNAKGETKTQKLSQTNAEDTLEIPSQSLPGTWTLKADGFGLMDQKTITISEHKMVAVEREGLILTLKNIGNVKFKEPLHINSQNEQKTKNLNLDLDESATVKLDKLFSPGTHTITIPLTGDTYTDVIIPEGEGIFDDLSSVTGNIVGGGESSGRTGLLILAFLGLLVALALFFKPHHKKVIKEEIVIQPKIKQTTEEFAPVNFRKEKDEHKPKYGIADEKDIADFRQRMLKTIQEDEKQRNRYGGSYTSPTPNSTPKTQTNNFNNAKPSGNYVGNVPPGAFDMFK